VAATDRTRHAPRLLLTIGLALGLLIVAAPAPAEAAWTGGINLYRSRVFTTQKTFLWCTAADVQIMRNMVRRQTDHSTTNQRHYFYWMRYHNRYSIPVRDGVDPQGWRDGLRNWVDARYQLVSGTSFDAMLRAAVKSLRTTNRPVGLLVSHGGHAWILHGFTATADPAATDRFTITSVRVTGPLWGLQNSRYGYDMPPNTRLTPTQLRSFWTTWHYARVRMVWEGRLVAIQVPAR
jgi:hypothetical protein